jgi:hypothetical protein
MNKGSYRNRYFKTSFDRLDSLEGNAIVIKKLRGKIFSIDNPEMNLYISDKLVLN